MYRLSSFSVVPDNIVFFNIKTDTSEQKFMKIAWIQVNIAFAGSWCDPKR
jgi:hypothetical protein